MYNILANLPNMEKSVLPTCASPLPKMPKSSKTNCAQAEKVMFSNCANTALHTPANILHVCKHKNVITMFQQKLHLLVNSE